MDFCTVFGEAWRLAAGLQPHDQGVKFRDLWLVERAAARGAARC